MTIKKLLSLSFFCLMGTFVYSQTATVVEGCAPLETTFSPPAGSTTYYWDFGDGGAFSTLDFPDHNYLQAGTYTASFSESAGGSVLGIVNITVYDKPTVDISATPTGGCVPLDVDFTDNSAFDPAIQITNLQWTFGDGNSSAAANPSHTYTMAGQFTVSLELTSSFSSCNVTQIFENIVSASQSPDVSFTTDPNPAASCEAPLSVGFINTSPTEAGLTYSWNFGNGNTSDDENPPAQTYTANGIFSVTLTITNDTGCPTTVTRTVAIGPPNSDFTIPDTVCIGQPTFAAAIVNSGNYLWDFGPNATPPASLQSGVEIEFNQAGLTTVSLTTTTGDCSSTTEKEVFVQEVDMGVTATPDFSCFQPFDVTFTPNTLEGITSYQWEFDSTFQTGQTPTFTFEYEDNNPYTIHYLQIPFVRLEVLTTAGCQFIDTLYPLNVQEPTAYFIADIVDGCVPLTVTLQDTSFIEGDIVSWEWNWGDGTVENATTPASVTHIYNTTGEYNAFLIVENSMGCIDTSFLQPVLVGEPIDMEFTVDQTSICPGDSIMFSTLTSDPNIDEWHYETDNGRSWHCFQEDETDWTFITETGGFDVSLTVGYNGCFSTTTQQNLIEVKGPITEIDYNMDCESPFEYNFADVKYEEGTVTWDFGDLTTSEESVVTHTYAETGEYQVSIISENPTTGCPVSVDSLTIFVKEIETEFSLDTIVCSGTTLSLDGGNSQDVWADCHRGYTWFPPNGARPITTQDTMYPFLTSGSGVVEFGLEVTDINGCRDTAYQELTLYEISNSFTQDATRICFPDTLSFAETSMADTTIVSWSWDFGDGGSSEELNPSHIFQNPPVDPGATNIFITLTVTDVIGCSSSYTDYLSFYEPFSNILTSPNPPSLCAGDDLTFIATDFVQEGSFLNFSWDFDNGTTSSDQSENVEYPNAGDYTITLDFMEAATGCAGQEIYPLNVQAYPEAAFSSSVDDVEIICFPEIINFMDESEGFGSPLSYFWTFGNGQTASQADPSAAFGKGIFTVTQNVITSNGCADQTTQSYTLVGPEGSIFLDQNQICNGDQIMVSLVDTVDISSYSWDFGDGNTTDNESPTTHQYDVTSTTNTFISLILKGENDACTTVEKTDIEIVQINAAFDFLNGDDVYCADEVITVQNSTSSEANTFAWTSSDGQNSSETNPTFTASGVGEITIELTASLEPLGCPEIISKTIIVNPLPTTTADGTAVCEGEPAVLAVNNPSDGSIYEWSINGNPPLLGATITVDNPTSSTVILSETDVNSCTQMTSLEIVIVDALEGENFDITTCPDASVPIGIVPNSSYDYMWQSSPDLSCTDCPNAVLAVPNTDAAEYNLTATDPLGACPPADYTFKIEILDNVIEIPNVFTPNGDDTNDFFNYVQLGDNPVDVAIGEFKVYDRWGKLVYDNDTPETGWDGQINGKPAVADVYVFLVKLNFPDGNCDLPEMLGDLTLVR
ncbi:MAG: gliding motility-associated-like protein [Saprospiraceae bacterium]|jgi:gliding motility-associated-like protein